MPRLFLDIVNLSITASWLILAVLATRLIFRKRAPKWVNCLLWGIVGLRLIFPFTIESRLSLVPARETVNANAFYSQTANNAYFQSGFDFIDDNLNTAVRNAVNTVSENNFQTFFTIASIIWLVGVALFVLHAVINYFMLKRRVAASVPCGNARKSEAVESPFVLGLFRPRIYLPFGLSTETEECVIAHEKAHIKRRDHLIKPIGYALLSVYWFSPLVWVAYILLCRDIECACDEKVVKNMNTEARKAYATALLECSMRKNYVAACPLAFGEVGVKDRVKNTVRYKKPAVWVLLCAVFACVTVSALFLTSPKTSSNDINLFTFSDKIAAQFNSLFTSDDGISVFYVFENDENSVENTYNAEYEYWRRTNGGHEVTEYALPPLPNDNTNNSWWSAPDSDDIKDRYFNGGW